MLGDLLTKNISIKLIAGTINYVFLSYLIYIILGLSLIGLIVLFVWKYYFFVRQAEAVIIERSGKFHRILSPGSHFIIPFFDKPRYAEWSYLTEVEEGKLFRLFYFLVGLFFKTKKKEFRRKKRTIKKIDLRETIYDFSKQMVITKDNVTIQINSVIYYKIINSLAAIYEVIDLTEAIEKLAQTTLRNIIGSMNLDDILVSRDQINSRLHDTLGEAALKWGVNITRVELQDINPPENIKLIMEKQMRAERDRRATVLEAEGLKQAAILSAEGKQKAHILEAKGIAEAKVIVAQSEAEVKLKLGQAEGEALAIVKKSLPDKDPSQYFIAMQYMKTMANIAEGKNNKVIVLPYESAVAKWPFGEVMKISKDDINHALQEKTKVKDESSIETNIKNK